jgi:hypothetical protein
MWANRSRRALAAGARLALAPEGAGAVKFRSTGSAAVAVEAVRQPYLLRRRRWTPSIPPMRMSRATRLRFHRSPRERIWAVSQRAP